VFDCTGATPLPSPFDREIGGRTRCNSTESIVTDPSSLRVAEILPLLMPREISDFALPVACAA
jgi:hypothetical protein